MITNNASYIGQGPQTVENSEPTNKFERKVSNPEKLTEKRNKVDEPSSINIQERSVSTDDENLERAIAILLLRDSNFDIDPIKGVIPVHRTVNSGSLSISYSSSDSSPVQRGPRGPRGRPCPIFTDSDELD